MDRICLNGVFSGSKLEASLFSTFMNRKQYQFEQ